MSVALLVLLAAWPSLIPPSAPETAAPQPVKFFFAAEDVRRVLPRDAVKRVGLIADLRPFESAVAAASFTAAAREQGLEVVPLPVGPDDRSAPELSAAFEVDAVALLRVGGLAGEGAVVDVWSRQGKRLEPLIARRPPTPEELERDHLEGQYASHRLGVAGAQQFVGDEKRLLSRSEFYRMVGREDLARREQGIAIARGALVGVGATAGTVGLVLELLQLGFYAAVSPLAIGACEVGRGLDARSNPYGPPDPKPCSGPELSPVPLFIAFGGGVMALTGVVIPADAASADERAELARGYNLRLRESLGPRPPAVSIGVSAAAVPEGGVLVLHGRF